MPPTRSSAGVVELDSADEKSVKKTKFDNSWMFLAKDDVFVPNSWSNIINLMHPRYERLSKYLIKKSAKKIYEIQTFSEPNRSWFIGETVKSDGSIFIVTPIDPVFLVLPHLRTHCSSRAIPLEQLLVSSEKDDLKQLEDLNVDLKCVADLKGPADLCAYKYNDDKTLDWLEGKVRRLAGVVRSEGLHVKSGAASATFVASSLKDDVDDEELYLKYAYGIVNEYLQDDLSQKLFEKFNFKAETIAVIGGANNKRKSDAQTSSDSASKRVKKEPEPLDTSLECKEDKKENINVTSDYFNSPSNQSKNVKPVQLTTKEKQLQKAASGSKSIMSFFGKKS